MQTGKLDSLDLLIGLVLATIILIYYYRRRLLDLRHKLDAIRLDQERNLVATRLEIQEETFQHIAREIHDNISLSLTLAKLHLHMINPDKMENISAQVNYSVELLSESITNLRNISRSLNVGLLESQGLIRTIELEVERIRKTGIFEVDFHISGEPIFLETNKELFIFRIIQEAFNNIIKHARATKSRLDLEFTETALRIRIEDNGIGFRLAMHGGEDCQGKAGLRNMHTRTKLIHGTMKIESAVLKGTKLFFNIPL